MKSEAVKHSRRPRERLITRERDGHTEKQSRSHPVQDLFGQRQEKPLRVMNLTRGALPSLHHRRSHSCALGPTGPGTILFPCVSVPELRFEHSVNWRRLASLAAFSEPPGDLEYSVQVISDQSRSPARDSRRQTALLSSGFPTESGCGSSSPFQICRIFRIFTAISMASRHEWVVTRWNR